MAKEDYWIDEIYHKYGDLMLNTALNILKDKDYAEDAVQISFEKIIINREKFNALSEMQVKKLIISITRNTAIDIYRKINATLENEISWEDVQNIPTVKMKISYEDEAYIALNQLPGMYKEIIDLKYSQGYNIDEIANKLAITETNAKQRLFRARKSLVNILKKGCVLLLCIVSLILTGVVINAAIYGKFWDSFKNFFGAKMITDENRDQIGKESIFDTFLFDDEEIKIPKSEYLANSRIMNSVKNKDDIPVYVSDIKTNNGMLPEILINVNACAVLYQADYAGWYCETGDTLCFDFSKYELENGGIQQLIVGYILNGVMYEGTFFDGLHGCYQLNIEENGEYYIYLVNVDLDYLSMKSGIVSIKKEQEN